MTKEELNKLRDELKKETILQLEPEKIIRQVETFEKGIPFIRILSPCKKGDGIKLIPESDHKKLIESFQQALDADRVMKFVPASGAASRMFKNLSVVLNEKDEPAEEALSSVEIREILENLNRFAFFNDLKSVLNSAGKKIEDLLSRNDVTEIIKYLLTPAGLNYANLPKGCVKFHSYPDGSRTAFEEHLAEAINYTAGKNGKARIHFTISPEHEQVVKDLLGRVIKRWESEGWQFDISISCQSPSTNMVAVTPDNRLFRDKEGNILLRPGGHGALLKNLNELKGDIVMIKNIDNVVPDRLKGETYKYKKILGGYLVELQKRIFSFIKRLENGSADKLLFDEIHDFIVSELEMKLKPGFGSMNNDDKRKYLFEFLNRPVRVCGMVKNTGEPGGGPFWIEDETGNISKQVVETTQIDLSDNGQKKIFENATHFSPTDFVCGLKDYKGNNFNLFDFVNPDTGLITKKTFNGRELKALELPGLWNGGMYYWLSVFVEVPQITFNPVKELTDLLKPEHQPERLFE